MCSSQQHVAHCSKCLLSHHQADQGQHPDPMNVQHHLDTDFLKMTNSHPLRYLNELNLLTSFSYPIDAVGGNYSGCISVVKGMNGWPRSAFSMARTTLRPCLRTVEM